MSKPAADVQVKESGGAKEKPWTPRMWNGMRVSSFFGLLAQNGFLVNPMRWPMAAVNLFFASPISSTFHLYQTLTLKKKIQQTELKRDPVFIIGNWCSG